MAWSDIKNIGKYLSIEDKETAVLTLCGEPEPIKNNFHEIRLTITAYHLLDGEWQCRQWSMSPKTAKAMKVYYEESGNRWPEFATEVSRTGEGSDTRYAFKTNPAIPAPKVDPLTRSQMEGKWERPAIPAVAGASAAAAQAGEANTAAKGAAVRMKYRILFNRATDAIKAELVTAFGDPDAIEDGNLQQAIEYAGM